MTRHATIWFCIALLISGCKDSNDPVPDANGVVVVPDELSCPTCSITFAFVDSLEVPADTTDDLPLHVEEDAQGRTWVLRQGDLPVLFDSAGRFLRVLGRTGQGPGEYNSPWSMLVLGRDSVLVMDRNQRGTLVDSTLTPRSYMTLPMLLRNPIVVRWPDIVVGSGAMPYQESKGALYHWSFVNGAPTIVHQFHMIDLSGNPELMLYTNHVFSTPRENHFWVSWQMRYVVGEFDSKLTRTRQLQRSPAWFPGTSAPNWNWKEDPPPPHMVGVAMDDDGLLWTFIHVAAKTWKDAWPTVPKGIAEVPSSRIQHDRLYATRIEVIDTRRSRVVARVDVDRYLVNPLPGRRAAFYHESDHGNVISIFAFGLKGR